MTTTTCGGENGLTTAVPGRISFVDGAPPVDLNVLVVVNHGVEVATSSSSSLSSSADDGDVDQSMGRIVRAKRDLTSLPMYSPLLRERPALVCEQGEYLEYMERFLDAPEDVQLGILDMFFQPLDGPMGRTLTEPARVLYLLGVLDDVTVIHQLLSIFITNGCQYRETGAAMAIFGSKFSHSCHPNAAYSSTATDGCLEYLLIRNDVRQGDEVTFSYLSDLFETATPERRRLLWLTKAFVCLCPRCTGPDYCRCLPCPTCQSPIPCRYVAKEPTNHDDDGDGRGNNGNHADEATFLDHRWDVRWECDGCGETADPDVMLHHEREIGQTLQLVSRQIESRTTYTEVERADTNTTTCDNPAFVRELVDECCTTLSTTHHLTVKALRLLVTVSTTKAYAQMKRQVARGLTSLPLPSPSLPTSNDIFDGATTTKNTRDNMYTMWYACWFKTWSFLRISVMAGIQLVLACECVAANCTGCYLHGLVDVDRTESTSPCNDGKLTTTASGTGTAASIFCIAHPPHYDRATPMRHVCENLLLLPIYLWPSDGLTMVNRYLPILQAKFKDILMDERRQMAHFRDNLQCMECSTNIVWNGKIESLLAG